MAQLAGQLGVRSVVRFARGFRAGVADDAGDVGEEAARGRGQLVLRLVVQRQGQQALHVRTQPRQRAQDGRDDVGGNAGRFSGRTLARAAALAMGVVDFGAAGQERGLGVGQAHARQVRQGVRDQQPLEVGEREDAGALYQQRAFEGAQPGGLGQARVGAWQEGGEAFGLGHTDHPQRARVLEAALVGGEEILHRHRQPRRIARQGAAVAASDREGLGEEHLEVAERADRDRQPIQGEQGLVAGFARGGARREGAQALDLRAEAQRRDLAEHGGVAREPVPARTPVERGAMADQHDLDRRQPPRRRTCIELDALVGEQHRLTPARWSRPRGPVPRWRCRRRPWR